MSYFQLHNDTFHKLAPVEFLVYCGLLSYANRLGSAWCRVSELAKRCAVSERSVCRATKNLETKKLINITKRYFRFDRRRSNLYSLVKPTTSFCKIDSKIFDLELSPTTFKVYVYLLRCAGKKDIAFPSLRKMSRQLGLSVDTIIDKSDYLVEVGLIEKKSIIKKQTRSFGVNNYFIKHKEYSCESIANYLNKLKVVQDNLTFKVLRTYILLGAVVCENVGLFHILKFKPKHTMLTMAA